MTTPNVNVPSNDKQKEADINQKTQLYGIFQAFALGKAPSNKQIDVALNSALASKALSNPSNQLSSDGKVLIADLRDVIEKAKLLFLTKNEGNLLQDFAWQCQNMGTGNAQKPGIPVDKDTAKQHGNEALDGLRTLGTLLITNGQFRKLLDDAITLARDVAGDGAQKAANKVNPSQDKLNQIDQPAEDNTWHEKPDFKGMKDNAMSKVKRTQAEAKDAAQSAANDAQAGAQNERTDQDAAANAADNAVGNLQQQASARIPDDKKDKTREQLDRVQDYLKEKMPKERREQTIWRLKKMVVEIQGHEDYQRAIDTLLRLAEEYQGHTKAVGADSAGAVKGAHSGNDSLNAAEADLRIVIERFANSTSMDDLIDSINQIYRDADNDPELKGWFRNLDTYIRKCLKEQGYILKDEATEEWNKLYDQGDFLLRERYRNHTNRIIDETKFLADQFDKDPQNRAFAESMNKLFNDLGTDRNGKPEFKPHLLKDLRDVIIPEIINSVRYIPIPDIEFTSTDADVVIRDLVVEADNILPNLIDLKSDNHLRYGRKGVKSTNKNKVEIHVAGIQTHLTNIRFYAKSKKGLKMRNWGLLDVVLANTGLDFKIKLETADSSDKSHFFKVTDVDVKISNFKLTFKEQHHPILTKVAALFAKGPLLQGPIKKVLEVKIKEAVQDFDALCYQVHSDVNKAKERAKQNPDEAQNIFKQYFDAYKTRLTRQKEDKKAKAEKAKAKIDEKQVQTNIAFTKDQRISKGWNNNQGIPIDAQEKDPKSGSGRFTLKAQEYKDLAASGDKWESPVFSLGSARESSTLPKPSEVTRKPHETAPSQVRGAQNVGNTTGSSSFTNGNSTGLNAPGLNSTGINSSGLNGNTGTGAINDKITTGTTLGTDNPVLSGRV